MDLEDRYKFIFVGFGIIRWIRLDMTTCLNGSGKIWMALSGFDWIWGDLFGFLDLAGSGCRFVWISKLDFIGHGGI